MAGGQGSAGALQCPSCGTAHPARERFCPACGVPLVIEPAERPSSAVTARQAYARKIKPQLTEGPLVRVAGARNQAEGEFIQGLLLEEGVPSLLRRSAGFDVPDFLAAGPRDVLVAQAGLMTAREILLEAELIEAGSPRPAALVTPARLLAGLLTAVAVGAIVVWLVVVLLGP
jgi:hypothetical protein